MKKNLKHQQKSLEKFKNRKGWVGLVNKGVIMEQEKLTEMIKSLIEKDKENFIKKEGIVKTKNYKTGKEVSVNKKLNINFDNDYLQENNRFTGKIVCGLFILYYICGYNSDVWIRFIFKR